MVMILDLRPKTGRVAQDHGLSRYCPGKLMNRKAYYASMRARRTCRTITRASIIEPDRSRSEQTYEDDDQDRFGEEAYVV